MSAAKLIFAQAIVQPEGNPLIVTCSSFGEAERIRVGLFRERTILFKTNPTLAARLVISRKQDSAGNWTVIVGAADPAFTVKTADGEEVDIFKQESSLSHDAEVERRLKLMREDGYSEEAIEAERKAMLEDSEDSGDSAA